MLWRRLLVLALVAAIGAGCGLEQAAGRPPLDLLAEDVTWVSTDGYDGRVRVVVAATSSAPGVVVEADTRALRGQAEILPGQDCELSGTVVSCRVGDLDEDSRRRLTLLTVRPHADAEVSDGYEVPISLRTRTSEPEEHVHVVHLARAAVLESLSHDALRDLAPDAEVRLRPGLLNVGAEPAEGVHLIIEGGRGTRFVSQYSNCRPVLPDGETAVCTFEQDLAPHAAVQTSAPVAFRMTGLIEGWIGYRGGSGAVDPAEVGPLGVAEGTAPELRLVPVDPKEFRSDSGGLAAGGTLLLDTTRRSTIAAVGDDLPARGERVLQVGVVNRGPGLVSLTRMPVQAHSLGSFTLEVPEGVEVLDIPFEDTWADCTPSRPGARRYTCALPDHLEIGQPFLQAVRVRVDEPGEPGSVTLDLIGPVEDFDDSTGDDTAVIGSG